MRTVFLLILVLVSALVWTVPTPHGLTVSFLDVGQGDSILLQTADGVELLVDGGPNSSVLRGLGEAMPFWDRELDAIVATHPDKDHIGGLVDVLLRYDVGTIFESGAVHDTSFTRAFEKGARDEGANRILAKRGMRLQLGSSAYADILFPDTDVSTFETNNASIVMKVVYGNTSVLLNGDSPQAIEGHLLSLDSEGLQSTILKAGHHGSRTSSAEAFVEAVAPKYAVYSRGCDNSYGHPHKEVVALFQKLKIPTFDTCERGTITFRSDGNQFVVQD